MKRILLHTQKFQGLKTLDEFKVQFSGLPNGVHHFNYEIESKFFEEIDSPLITDGSLKVEATMHKMTNMLSFDFKANGLIDVECDRCLAAGKLPIEGETIKFMVVKFDDSELEIDNDELVILPVSESEINLSSYIFEFINTLKPLSIIPCEIDGNTKQCNQDVLEKLNQVKIKTDQKDVIDPRWAALQALKNPNNN